MAQNQNQQQIVDSLSPASASSLAQIASNLTTLALPIEPLNSNYSETRLLVCNDPNCSFWRQAALTSLLLDSQDTLQQSDSEQSACNLSNQLQANDTNNNNNSNNNNNQVCCYGGQRFGNNRSSSNDNCNRCNDTTQSQLEAAAANASGSTTPTAMSQSGNSPRPTPSSPSVVCPPTPMLISNPRLSFARRNSSAVVSSAPFGLCSNLQSSLPATGGSPSHSPSSSAGDGGATPTAGQEPSSKSPVLLQRTSSGISNRKSSITIAKRFQPIAAGGGGARQPPVKICSPTIESSARSIVFPAQASDPPRLRHHQQQHHQKLHKRSSGNRKSDTKSSGDCQQAEARPRNTSIGSAGGVAISVTDTSGGEEAIQASTSADEATTTNTSDSESVRLLNLAGSRRDESGSDSSPLSDVDEDVSSVISGGGRAQKPKRKGKVKVKRSEHQKTLSSGEEEDNEDEEDDINELVGAREETEVELVCSCLSSPISCNQSFNRHTTTSGHAIKRTGSGCHFTGSSQSSQMSHLNDGRPVRHNSVNERPLHLYITPPFLQEKLQQQQQQQHQQQQQQQRVVGGNSPTDSANSGISRRVSSHSPSRFNFGG